MIAAAFDAVSAGETFGKALLGVLVIAAGVWLGKGSRKCPRCGRTVQVGRLECGRCGFNFNQIGS